MSKAVEIIKGRLFWISSKQPPTKSFRYITQDLVYDSFNQDFGPLNLGKTWKYVSELEKLLAQPQNKANQIYHYTSVDPEKAANSAYLMGAFQIISLGLSAQQAFQPFKGVQLKPFRDAGYAQCTYKCTLLDCLNGLEYAIKLGWFNHKAFNLAQYEHYEKIQNGDLNWIIPNKFIAFSSPSDKIIDKYGNRTFTPNDYVPVFKKLGVSTVVRLNNKTYESSDFVKKGINHHQLYFADGSVPSMQIVHQFLQLAEKQKGAIAVHCKAGLGRTGTLIACYAMKHYYFPAAAFIGWIRIARPGSILGPQQNYLIQIQKRMREEGINSPIWNQVRQQINEKEVLTRMKNVSLNDMNQREIEIMKNGEFGQGQGLVDCKYKKDSNLKFSAKERSYSKGSDSGKPSPKIVLVGQLSFQKNDFYSFVLCKSHSSNFYFKHLKYVLIIILLDYLHRNGYSSQNQVSVEFSQLPENISNIQVKLIYFIVIMSQQLIVVPIGIDLGSLTSKIAVAKRGGVEVITNDANFRQTPCIVGYGPAQRNIGEAGNIKMKSNFKDTVSFPSRFLGLRPDNPFLRSQKKFCPAKCTTKDDKVAFEVKYQGQPEVLFPQQIYAAYLNKLKLIIQKNNFDNKTAVIAVPPYFTQFERKAVLDAAKIAELGVTRLLNQSTAVALDYGMFRKNQLDATTPRNVLFIDFGHSKLSVFACGFTNAQMNVLEQDYCRHIGCRDIDYHLLEFYRSHFQRTSGGLDLSQNRKAVIKLMENIERQRKILSGNSQHDMNIEYLMEENDLHYTMKREEFQKISEPIFRAVVEVLTKMKDTLKQKNINLHSIELIGGGTRIPAFVSLVKSVFGIQPSRTLNSSESVARGCALMAAIKSPLFRVPDYALNEKAYYGIKFYWNFVDGQKFLGLDSSLYPAKQGKFIYEAGAKVPTSKTVKFARKQAIQVLIEYEPSVNGFNKHIGYFVTKPQNPKEQTFGVSFKIKYTEDGLVLFDECNLVEEWFEETKIPKKKAETPKPADPAKPAQGQPQKMQEQQFQIKKTKKEKYSAIKYDSNTFDSFTAKDIEAFFTIESTMLNQDKLIIQTYERKNELESLAYSWKEKLNSSHKEFAKPQQIPEIVKFLEDQSEWLYNQGQNSNRGVYNQRINSVKNKVSPVLKRYENFEAALLELKVLQDCIKYNMDFLNSLDKKYEHISSEQRQQGFNLIDRVRAWVVNANQKQKQLPKWQDLAINAQQIKDQIREINEKVKTIMGKKLPPPPPKPEEKKEQPSKEAPKKGEGEPMQTQKQPEKSGEKMDVE